MLINYKDRCSTCAQRYHCDLQEKKETILILQKKNETILVLISLTRYFSHPEKSILYLSLA